MPVHISRIVPDAVFVVARSPTSRSLDNRRYMIRIEAQPLLSFYLEVYSHVRTINPVIAHDGLLGSVCYSSHSTTGNIRTVSG
jgi:hypothetical protein